MRVARILRFAAGAGGPKKTPGQEPAQNWRWKVSGLTWKDMKKHYAIIPMYGFSILAVALAVGYTYRMFAHHPEVAWTKKSSEPWNDYRNKQYKFVDTGRDYSKGSPSPTYK